MEAKEFAPHCFDAISHWRVRDAKVYKGNQGIRVQDDLQLGKKDYRPESQLYLSVDLHSQERQCRYLDSCQFKTTLVARVPGVVHPEHGVCSASVP
jgi:hypothetical protein